MRLGKNQPLAVSGRFCEPQPAAGTSASSPIRAEGIPKQGISLESVAAQRHLSPRRPANCERRPAYLLFCPFCAIVSLQEW